MTYSPHINETNSLSNETRIKQLKQRLRKLNRLIRSDDAAPADYANRDRVAFELQALKEARRMTVFYSDPMMA